MEMNWLSVSLYYRQTRTGGTSTGSSLEGCQEEQVEGHQGEQDADQERCQGGQEEGHQREQERHQGEHKEALQGKQERCRGEQVEGH